MTLKDPVHSLKYITKRFTIPCENITPTLLLGDERLNNTYVTRDTRASYQLLPPFILNKHIHPFGICDPKYQRYLNSVIHLLLPILRTMSTRGSLSKCLFETAHGASSSTDMDALKLRLVQYGTFCGCQIQQDSSECLMMLTKVVSKGSVPLVVLILIIPHGFLYLKSYFHLC